MITPTKTQLQQSYQTSEHLYDQVFALVSTLQAWARPETQDQMSAETRQHIQTLIRLAWQDILRLARQFMDLPAAHVRMEFYGGEHPSQTIVEGTPEEPGCLIARVFEFPHYHGDPDDEAAWDDPESWAPSPWALQCLAGFLIPQEELEGPGEPTPSGEIVMAGDIEVDGHIYQRAILVQFPTEEATRAAFQNSQNGQGFLITFPTFEKGETP